MAVSAFASGTQAAVINTEHVLSTINIAGVYTLHVDTVNMVSGDTLELRVYQMVLTGGTTRVAMMQSFTGLQPTDDEIKISSPIGNDLTDATALQCTLKQTAGGAGRNFQWKILTY